MLSIKDVLAICGLVLLLLVSYWFDFYWRDMISLVIPMILFLVLGFLKGNESKMLRITYYYRILLVPLGYLILKKCCFLVNV